MVPLAAVTVKVALLVMNTVSPEAGTWAGDQLAAVFQSPLAAAFHVIVAAESREGCAHRAAPNRQTYKRSGGMRFPETVCANRAHEPQCSGAAADRRTLGAGCRLMTALDRDAAMGTGLTVGLECLIVMLVLELFRLSSRVWLSASVGKREETGFYGGYRHRNSFFRLNCVKQ